MEHIFSDFSGGMNAVGAVDKLDPRECLLAENVRLDEMGNVQSAGALTRQNTAAYAAAAGTTTNNVHSLFWNPAIGGVAGVGQDVFVGGRLGTLTSALAAANATQSKMSFVSAPGRVYFDVGSSGYWTDINHVLKVDWIPPSAAGGISQVGPTIPGTSAQFSDADHALAWQNPGGLVATTNTAQATTSSQIGSEDTEYLQATMTTNSFAFSGTPGGVTVQFTVNTVPILGGTAPITLYCTLLKAGIPVGETKTLSIPIEPSVTNMSYILGNASDLWSSTWVQGDINAGNFGFQVWAALNDPCSIGIFNAMVTVNGGSGFGAGTGAAGALTGTYTWKVAFVAINGEESAASNDSAPVILSGSQGTLTSLQIGDARTIARNVYRKGNALTSYYLVGTIQDNVSTTYSDNQTDIAALAQGSILSGDVPGDYPNTRLGSQQVGFPTYHYDRVFWIIPGTHTLKWSKPLNGFSYPSIYEIDVGDDAPCIRTFSQFGELIIIKTDSIWRLTGTDESSFDLSATPSPVGSDQPFTCVLQPDGIRFANRWGTWIFNGYTSVPFTNKLDTWFKQEDRSGVSLFGVNGFHPPEVSNSMVTGNFDSVANSEKWYVAYAEAAQSANNAMVLFDLKHNNITKRTIPSAPLSMAIDPVTGLVYVGDNQGYVSLLDDWNGTTQGGSNANFDFQTSYFDLQRGSNKTLWALEFFINTHGQTLTPYVYYDAGAASETLASFSASGLQRVVRPVEATNARKMQNFSVRLNGSLSAVNSSGTPQIQLVHVKALYDIRVGRARTGQ